jgi:hypothetical protein
MEDKKLERLKNLLEELKKAQTGGVKASQLTDETKYLMSSVETALNQKNFKFVGDNGFGQGTRPPKIPGYDRIPDFAVDRNGDDRWDMIIEIKSSTDWNQSDEQLKDFWTYSKDNNLDFLIVVSEDLFNEAEKRYASLGFKSYDKYNIVPIG